MTTEEMKDRKTALGLTNEMIAEAADIPLSTVQRIKRGGAPKTRNSGAGSRQKPYLRLCA